MIISTWRSGSSFFGDILNAIPGNYYHFEPLMFLGDVQLRKENWVAKYSLKTITELLQCNYKDHAINDPYALRRNTALSKYCDAPYELCNSTTFLSVFCQLFPYQSMKLVRLRLNLVEKLLKNSNLNVKIVYLIRDPRGIMTSRMREHWCNAMDECGSTTQLCNDMVLDFNEAKDLSEKYPNRFKVIRYEDLSLNPFDMTKMILDFYGLPFHKRVQEFLDTHTNVAGNKHGMSTIRDSKAVPFSWIENLSFQEIDDIQKKCTEAMNLWGYATMLSEDEMNSATFNPLLAFPFAYK